MRLSVACWALLACLALGMAPARSQDAKDRIALQRQVRNMPSNILVMFSDGTQTRDLAESTVAPLPRVTPALAPDGRTIAFAAKVGERYKIFTWALDEQNNVVGEPLQVTKDPDTHDKFPSWSPNGEQLAYLATDQTNKSSLRVVNADGSGAKVLADVRYLSTPSWRYPTGDALLFIDQDSANAPVLKNILASGGMALTIRGQSRIVAVSQAPQMPKDNMNIAVLVQNEDGLCDLCLIKAFGPDIRKLATKISDAKSVVWSSADSILFNASKVNGKPDPTGKALWMISPGGGNPKSMSGLATAKEISYLAMQKGDLSAALPTPVAPSAGPGPNGNTTAPKEIERIGTVAIARPFADATIRGSVGVKVLCQANVASVVLKINSQFMYAAAPQNDDNSPLPYVTFTWQTQQFNDIDPARGKLPATYQQVLRYPDGGYTLSVQALDKDNKLVGTHSIKVMVKNLLPDSDFPDNLTLKYKFSDQTPDEFFAIRGDATLFGANPGQASAMNATLNATLRRSLIQVTDNGKYDLRTYIREPQGGYGLSYGLRETSLPESDVSAIYSLSPSGDLAMVPQQREKIYLPFAQLNFPLKTEPVSIGTQWPSAMWIVGDLLDRDATTVRANHAIDGVEWVGDRRCIRIRSTYKMDQFATPYPLLGLIPTRMTPVQRTTKAQMLANKSAPAAGGGYGMGMPTTTTGGTGTESATVKFQEADGIRYSWVDYQKNALVRVEDLLLYAFPTTNLPGTEPTTTPGMTGTPGMPGAAPMGGYTPAPPPPTMGDGGNPFGGGVGTTATPSRTPPLGGANLLKPKVGTAWYLVHYSYQRKEDEP